MSDDSVPATPQDGDLRVYYIHNMWSEAYTQPVASPAEAQLVIDSITGAMLFAFDHHQIPDYADVAGIERYESDGEGGYGWYSVEFDPETGEEI